MDDPIIKNVAWRNLFFSPQLKPRCQGRVICFGGGGCNIAIATALPPWFFMHCIVNIRQFLGFLYDALLKIWETHPGPRRPVPDVSRIFCSNVRGLAGNPSDLTVASSRYEILLFSEPLVTYRSCWLQFWSPSFVVQGKDHSGQMDGGIHMRWIRKISPTQIRMWFLKNYVFWGWWCATELSTCSDFTATLHELDGRIFDCLLTSMAPCRLRMRLPLSCLWGIWMVIIKSGWVLQPQIVIALQLLTLPHCVWLWSVVCRPYPCTWWNIWPPDDWCSWHSTSCCWSTHRYLRSLQSVVDILMGQAQPWRNIWPSDYPVDVLNEHLSLLVWRYVPTKVMHVRNKDKPWFDDQCRSAFDLK